MADSPIQETAQNAFALAVMAEDSVNKELEDQNFDKKFCKK